MASGDHIFVSQSTSWMAGSADLNAIPPLQCAGEVLVGAHNTKLMGSGQYQAAAVLDATTTMIYQYQTDAQVDGIYRDSLMVDSFGSPWNEMICGAMPEEEAGATSYCSMAQVQSLGMGDLSIRSQGAILQADVNVSDSLASQISIAGDGMGRIIMQSMSMSGVGNTTGLGYTNRIDERVTALGRDMQVASRFQYESFANLWSEELPEETG
ncbi:MAG: hypothetical protein PHH09_13545 [Methanoregulaceae archaeon]|nr:hypothetical protein [Methanoregulaceae archaeon]